MLQTEIAPRRDCSGDGFRHFSMYYYTCFLLPVRLAACVTSDNNEAVIGLAATARQPLLRLRQAWDCSKRASTS